MLSEVACKGQRTAYRRCCWELVSNLHSVEIARATAQLYPFLIRFPKGRKTEMYIELLLKFSITEFYKIIKTNLDNIGLFCIEDKGR